MTTTILDCYTDEASGLGVPPYLGTYPRYIAGSLDETPHYLTIDDLRLAFKRGGIVKVPRVSEKTDIGTYNLTVNSPKVQQILEETDILIIILGVHVPGKYLTAYPGTLHEIIPLLRGLRCKKILTGPAVMGTQMFGGKFYEKEDLSMFDKVDYQLFNVPYEKVKGYAPKGAAILKQIPDHRMIEIETGKGCDIGKCSFCTEPLKSRVLFRDMEDVLLEIKTFYDLGARFFRLGKQTCFYTYPRVIELLKEIRRQCPGIKVLHIDNVNPVKVVRDKDHEITKAIVECCTAGNIAAHGVESFDKVVVKENTLNTIPEIAYKAVQIINKYGSVRGDNGMPAFLPGINIIFGLRGETKKTHEENMKWLKKMYDDSLMLRRINIRQVAIFEGTSLHAEGGDKWLKKNRRWYWKWRNDIRQNIDFPMLQRVVPKGTVMKECYAEMYDGNTTFCRQFGTYPLIVGVKGRLELKKFYGLEISGHMLRSITGKVVGSYGDKEL
ncbi:radical SAM protein [Candidatus Woesearchaeota archaeon]|nr:radical SAM protein [Candidatus Woesearchaeota archaeon]